MENLTRCGEVLLENRIVLQLVKKFHLFYGTWRFITIFKTVNCPYPKASECNSCFLILFKLNSNIILPSMPRSSKCSLPSHFPPKPYVITLLPSTCPAHPPWRDHYNIWSGVNTVKLNMCILLCLPITTSILGPYIFLKTLSLYSYLIFHTHKE